MNIDHLFVFSNSHGQEANELLKFGFVEGSSRVHSGQGTTNRKFYFDNFFLELLWVIDEQEVISELVAPTKLRERSGFASNQISPFGLCLDNTTDTDYLFATSIQYQPVYFPTGLSIDVVTNDSCPSLPWTFRLPFKGDKKKTDEPTSHSNGIRRLTKTEFVLPYSPCTDAFIDYFSEESAITFSTGNNCRLTLTFDNYEQKKQHQFTTLPITIKY